MFESLDNLEAELHGLVKALDPHALTPVEAADAVHAFAALARIATTGLTRLADRAGACTRWRQRDFADVGSWVADELGATVPDGRRLHAASTRPDLCPDTWQLMARGTIAPLAGAEIIASAVCTERARAAAVARAAAEAEARRRAADEAAGDGVPDVDVEAAPVPAAALGKSVAEVERDLLDVANDRAGTIRRLRDERDKAEAAARDEVQAAIHAFLSRSITFSQRHDGMGEAHVRLDNGLMAVVRAILDANADKLFRQGGRGANGRAPSNANLLADAFVLLLAGRLPEHPSGVDPGPTRPRRKEASSDQATARSDRAPAHGEVTDRPPEPTQTSTSPSAPPSRSPGHSDEQTDGVPDRHLSDDDPRTGQLPLDLPPDRLDGATTAVAGRAQRAPVGATGEVIVRVDGFALARGRRLPGEDCEIVGAGQISITDARRLAAHACIDVVIRDHGRVTTVACTGRRLARHLHPADRTPPPRHRTRLVLLLDATALRGPGDQLHLPGTGPVSRALLLRALPAAAIEILAACAVDPDTIDTDGRTYPRPLSVAVRETNPRCPRCGFERWLQTDHVLALALGGRTTRTNLSRPCIWCHAAKTKAEAPATIRAGRRRAQQQTQPPADAATRPGRRRRRRPRTASPADNP